MKIETKFDMHQRIWITEIETPGRIINIALKGKNLWYFIEYWLNGELKSVELNEEEIEVAP